MIKFFVNKFVPVLCFAILIVIMGANAYKSMPRESFPEIEFPYIYISTIYAGVSAKDIESLVSTKLEKELEGLDGLEKITSTSMQSASTVFLKFSDDVSVEEALRKVKDRVDTVDLPEDAEDPYVKEVTVSDWISTLTVVLSHPNGVATLDKFAKKLQDDLENVKGVLSVDMSGHQTWEVAVELDPLKLEHYDISISDVQYAITSEHTTIPGGILKNSKRSYSLSVTGEIKDPNKFSEIIVSSGGRKVKLKDLGEVSFKPEEPNSYARLNGESAITLDIKKKMGADVIKLIEDSKVVVEESKASIPPGGNIEITNDASEQINNNIMDLENNMFTSIILVLLVTFLFLGKTNSIFVSIAIPFSMLISFFVLNAMGITLNQMTLFSLILALGMLVDNGIVIVENIFRHAAMGKSRKQAAIDGTKEVSGAIIASTLTTCLVFFPILLMPGEVGSFMGFIPKTVIIVLFASLAVGLTITPTFCAKFLRMTPKAQKKMVEGGGFFGRLQNFYYNVINYAIDRKKRFIVISISICLAGMVLFGILGNGSEFFPEEDPNSIYVTVEAPSGSSIEETDKFVKKVEQLIPESPSSLRSFTSNTNSGGDGRVTVNYKPFLEREISGEEAQIELTKRLKKISGAKFSIENNSGMGGSPISYRVIGEDYVVLGEISQKIVDMLYTFDAVKLADMDYEASEPEYLIEVNREKAAFYGLTTQGIASTIRNAINGSTVGKYRVDEDEYDINVRYEKNSSNSIESLKNLQITVDGKRIALRNIATITPGNTTGVIKREALQRTVNVFGNYKTEATNTQITSMEIHEKVEEIKKDLPKGYDIVTGSEGEEQAEVTMFLANAFIIAIFLIFILLIGQFNSIADPVIGLSASLLAVGGVFWGFWIWGMKFGIIMSGIGCISLIGVAVNNCIVLIDYTNLLIKDGMDWRKAIPEAGKTRLKPVILTALTTVLALIPMGFGVSFDVHTWSIQVGSATADMWKSFAWAMMFGLSFSTFMTLIIVPVMLSAKHSVLEKFRLKKEAKNLVDINNVEAIIKEEADTEEFRPELVEIDA